MSKNWIVGTLAAALLAVLAGTVGYRVAPDHPCRAHEVYVVDTDRCVAGDDHGAHGG